VELHSSYLTFFVGVLLTGLGSMYYHFQPSNQSLLWDRLPMTISFSAFFSAVVGEYISPRCAMTLFLPLLGVGIASVVYWHVSELNGNGDLRAYILVQFLPVLLIPLILVLYNTPLSGSHYIWGIIGVYALSKLMEHFDAPLYTGLGFISGHTLKHVTASLGAWIFYRALQERQPLSSS
ncbi:MAG: alkaline phytoceramidase, partial [Methylococcales bacterium]|nr:alkaline phytoceramidase [Methylococcales bacterium]